MGFIPVVKQSRSALVWTTQQADALDQFERWLYSTDDQVFQIRGPAGTGKTELAVHLINKFDGLGLAFQNRAAALLGRKGAHSVSTCHSFLYGRPQARMRLDGTEELRWLLRDHHEPADLLVLDEVSQIDSQLGRDLRRRSIKLATFGDSLQMPPIGTQHFDNEFPIDVELTEVHRQALNSPVLRLATQIREGGELPRGERFEIDDLLDADMVVCAFKRSRQNLNIQIRKKRFGLRNGGGTPPQAGERIIATRNCYAAGIFNGTIWEVAEVHDHRDVLHLTIHDEAGGYVECIAPMDGFNSVGDTHHFPRAYAVFDYAHALTGHRAQGGEWGSVVVLDETRQPGFERMAGEMPVDEFRRRWMYVAVSRARESVRVVRL